MATVATIDIFGVETHPDVRVVVIDGTLDESNLDDFKAKIDPLVADPEVRCVILNCKQLRYINSKIVGFLASTYSQISERGGKLIMAESSETIADIISMVGLNMIIEQAASTEEALSMVASAGPAVTPSTVTQTTQNEAAVSETISIPVSPSPVVALAEMPLPASPASDTITAPVPPAASSEALPTPAPLETFQRPVEPVSPEPEPEPPAVTVTSGGLRLTKSAEMTLSGEAQISIKPGSAAVVTPAEPELVPASPIEVATPVTSEIPASPLVASPMVNDEPVLPSLGASSVQSEQPLSVAEPSVSSASSSRIDVQSENQQEVVLMLGLPRESPGQGGDVFMTEDESIKVQMVSDSFGRRIEIRFKPGQYFFDGKTETTTPPSNNMILPNERSKKSFLGSLFGKK